MPWPISVSRMKSEKSSLAFRGISILFIKMSNQTEHSKAPKPSLKLIGRASGRAWKVVKDDDNGNSMKPELLSDFLLEYINTPNLLVLAGSGTSLGDKVNGPSMSKLWVGAKKLSGYEATAKAVKHPADDSNIENLLSRCKGAVQFLPDEPTKNIVNGFVELAENMIFEQCNGFLKTADLGTHKEFLRRLASRSTTKPRLRLFTTNYDRCFEQAAGELGYAVVDGFSFSMPRRYAANFFSYDFVRRDSRQREAPDFVENVFHLLKLHGSVDWDAREGGITMDGSPSKRCLIYPASTKYELSYTQPYLEMMAQFLTALREPNTALVTIGFGFADEHLKQPIRAAIEANTGLRLLVVDRSCEDKANTAGSFHELLRKRIEAKDDRISLINADFDQFTEQVPNLARMTQEEKLAHILKALSKKS